MKNSTITAFALFSIFLCSSVGSAAQITLSWNANADSVTTGYKIYYGTESRNYGTPINVGNVTTFTLTGLTQGQAYFIAATAYNASGLESDYSNEVSGLAKDVEIIGTPGMLSGPINGTTGTSYTYSTGGSSSTLGDPVQYQFDWNGDASDLSPWGATSQSKIWTTAGTYNVRARARCATHMSVISNWSSPLSVTLSMRSIIVTSPNGGQTWAAGTTHTISWTYTGNPGSYVKIELLKNGVLNRTISSYRSIGSGGSGSCPWVIPTTQAGGSDYQIRVTSTTNSAYTDTSNANFMITGPPPPSITVTSPNGGETWAAGTTHTISWTYSGNLGSYVKIELLKGGVLNRTISSFRFIGSGGIGSYPWVIPSTQAGGSDYQFRVTSTSNTAYTDKSNQYFSIAP